MTEFRTILARFYEIFGEKPAEIVISESLFDRLSAEFDAGSSIADICTPMAIDGVRIRWSP